MKGSLQEKHGTFYVVVNYKDEYGKPKSKWISTGLRVQNNKTKAKEEMKKILKNLDQNPENLTKKDLTDDIYFIDFLHSYLPLKKQCCRQAPNMLPESPAFPSGRDHTNWPRNSKRLASRGNQKGAPRFLPSHKQ